MKKAFVCLFIFCLLLISGSSAIGCYEYPVVEQGKVYSYCSHFDFDVMIELDARGNEWIATKRHRPNVC